MNKLHQELHLRVFDMTKGEGRTTIQEPTLKDIELALSKVGKTTGDIPSFDTGTSLFNQSEETKEKLLTVLTNKTH